MNLSQKIFMTFFISVTALLCITLYLIDTQAEQHEIEGIISDFNNTQRKFQHDLDARQQHIQILSSIMTTDQKFRSFLSQIKDNFYPFSAEIGRDTGADFVFMLDDEPSIRAVYKKESHLTLALNEYFNVFEINQHLETALSDSKMISLAKGLYSSHFIPLKESLHDDYAVGLIIVINEINDLWVEKFLSSEVKYQAIFFNQGQIIAKNTSAELAQAVLDNRHAILETGRFYWQQQRYIGQLILFESDNQQAGYILSANLDQALVAFKQLQQTILLIGASILALGAFLFIWISRQITQPLRLITQGTLAIEEGDYQYRIGYQSKDEVGQLANSFNTMAGGLEERERIRNTFSTYVDPVIVAELLSQPDKLKLGGERKQQSVLFSDIAGFTNFSEKLPAEILVKILNEYLTAMTHEISQQQGILDKFIGDAIMAFWSPQICDNQHAQRACETALNMQNSLQSLRPIWQKNQATDIFVRIGIATGDMIVGNIGSEQARSYTCIGDNVNYSSRLEGLNKYYGTEVMIDERTAHAITGLVVRELDTVQVKGREQGAVIYQLIGRTNEIDAEQHHVLECYQQALQHYRAAEFNQAAKIFSQLKQDGPSQIMLARCETLQKKVPENWQGISVMLEK